MWIVTTNSLKSRLLRTGLELFKCVWMMGWIWIYCEVTHHELMTRAASTPRLHGSEPHYQNFRTFHTFRKNGDLVKNCGIDQGKQDFDTYWLASGKNGSSIIVSFSIAGCTSSIGWIQRQNTATFNTHFLLFKIFRKIQYVHLSQSKSLLHRHWCFSIRKMERKSSGDLLRQQLGV